MVFDHAGKYLYISTSDGYVRAYNLATNQLESGYYLGGSLNGIDIAADDSFLLIAQKNLQSSQIVVHRLNLGTGDVTNIGFTISYDEQGTGAWDVVVTSNGLAMMTMYYGGSGNGRVRQIDLATNAISTRLDVPGSAYERVTNNTQIHRSADGTRLSFLEGNSGGPIFFYDATTNTFGPKTETLTYQDSAGAAISWDGSMVGTRLTGNGASLDGASDLTFIHNFHDADSGIAFDATSDTLYAVNSSASQIIAYDTVTFLEKFRLDIGEPISAGVTQFGTGNFVASSDGKYLALATPSGIRLFSIPTGPFPLSVLPTFGTPRDLVFDHAGRYLYVTTAEGFVWPFNLSTNSLETPYNLGGSLNGLDIAADDSFLVVAQGYSGIAQGTFQKLDLATGSVTNINYTHSMFNAWTWSGEWGAWNVVIASNALAFTTTAAKGGSTFAPVRQIDLATNVVATRTDTPGSDYDLVTSETVIHRGADRTRLYFLETRISSNPAFTYSGVTNTFGPAVMTNNYDFLITGAVNRNGTLLGTRRHNMGLATFESAPAISFVHGFNYLDSGVTFDAIQDTFYGVNSSKDQIVAYDTNTYAEKFRFDIGEDVSSTSQAMGTGNLTASQDGRYLALITPTTVRVYSVPAVQLVSVVSEKTHGGAGVFDLNLPLDGPRAIECRSGGLHGDHKIIFTFGLPLNDVGSANVNKGVATIASARIDSSDPHRYIVDLTGVPNAQYLKITLADVSDIAGNHTVSISQQFGVLVGDTTGNDTVNSSDVAQVQSQSGQPVTQSNFREDVSLNGAINSSDVAMVQSLSGSGIGAAPIAYSLPTPEPVSTKSAASKRLRK